jgi:hypothetical protein
VNLVDFLIFLSKPWVFVTLAVTAMILVLWRLRPFWRLRDRFSYWLRRRMAEEVWTDKATVLDIISKSQWAMSRNPNAGIGYLLSAVSGIGEMAFRGAKFDRFCELVLQNFVDANPTYLRITEGKSEYREDKLRVFLQEAFDDDVRKQFGAVPYKTV